MTGSYQSVDFDRVAAKQIPLAYNPGLRIRIVGSCRLFIMGGEVSMSASSCGLIDPVPNESGTSEVCRRLEEDELWKQKRFDM